MRLRDEQRSYLLAGAFVLAMIAAGVTWVAVLAGVTGRTDGYSTRFDSVLGLADGSQVLFEGYRIGVIDGIEPMPEGDFRVRLSVEQGWPIPADSRVRLASSGLLAAVVLNIERGTSDEMLDPGAEIESVRAADVFASVQELADELSLLVRDQITPLVSSVGERAPRVLENLDSFAVQLDQAGQELGHILSEDSHERIDRILGNLERGSAGAEDLLEGLSRSRERVDSVLVDVDELMSRSGPDLEASLADLRVSLEALARRSDAITHHLEATTRNLNEFSQSLRRDPSLLLRGSDGVEPVPGERSE